MNKYIIITLLSLSLFSCSKDVSVDGAKINTSSGLSISAESGSIVAGENGVEITSGNSEISIGSSGVTISDGESEVKMDENGMTLGSGTGVISITNTGTEIGGINISSGNVAEDFIKNSIGSDVLGDIELDGNSMSSN